MPRSQPPRSERTTNPAGARSSSPAEARSVPESAPPAALDHTPRSLGNRGLQQALAEPAPSPRPRPAAGLLVEDESPQPRQGQMRRREFLAALKAEVCATADEGLAGTGRTSQGCPWIQYWFDLYAGQSVAHLERAIRRFAPEGASARDAHELIRVLAARVRRSVDRWARTGEVAGLPEGVSLAAPGPAAGILFSAQPGGATAHESAGAVQQQLGPGHALEGGLRGKMESAFGASFGHVRAHTDAGAAGLAGSMNARAFTVGEHVAFGAGEYQPGTVLGDALIAHELAHVVQQGGPSAAGASPQADLDQDADRAAAGAVSALWGPLPDRARAGPLAAAPKRARPALHAGLRVQRCSSRPQGPPLNAERLRALTPWQLRELPEEELTRVDASAFSGSEPRPADYLRARRLAQAVLSFDIDTPPGPGREPSSSGCSGPSEMQVLDRNLAQILGSNRIASRLTNPLPREGGQPSLRGRVWLATRDGMAAARYRLELHIAGVSAASAAAATQVRGLWTAHGISAAPDARITQQERRIAAYSQFALAPAVPNGLYQVAENRIYIPDFVDLTQPEGSYLARHETAHLIGGRDRLRLAFLRRFGGSWLEWFNPFNEGMAELVSMESLPAGQSPPAPPMRDVGGGRSVGGDRYEEWVGWMQNIARDPADRELMFRAYFTGDIPERVFELIARERRVALPPAPAR
jgi:hypothetical protein